MTRDLLIRIAKIVAVLAVLTATVMVIRYFLISSDDDRGPIIVKGGSVTFDDGDPSKPKQWKQWEQPNSADAKRWRPKHPNGWSVKAFDVTVTGASDPACPTSPASASDVAIDYTLTGGTSTTQVKVERQLWFTTPGQSKWEPWVTAPADLVPATPSTTAPSAPPRLVYNPGDGYISKVTLTTSSGNVTCPVKPEEKSNLQITVQPTK